MRRPYVLLLMSATAIGCSELEGDSGWTTAVDTLPSGAVRVVNAPPAEGPAVTHELAETLRIGSVEGGGPTSFGEIRAIAVLPDGRIAVLDAQAKEVRIFGVDGAHLATYGGPGDGPGELRNPYGLMVAPDGQLRVPDHSANRMTTYHPDSGYTASHSFNVLSYGYVWRGAMSPDGRIYEQSMTLGPPRREMIRVYAPDMTMADSILLPEGPPAPADPPGAFAYRTSRGGGFISVPFYAGGHIRMTGDGAFWTSDGSYRIARWVPGGDTTLVIEASRAPVPVTPAERDSAIEAIRAHLETRGAPLQQDWSKIPDVKPAVTGLMLSDDGDVWVQTSTADGSQLFDVFDSSGRYRHSVRTTARLNTYVPPVIRGDTIWAVVRDELDVPHVMRAHATPVQQSQEQS